jgi:hypothetical protein
MTQVNLTSVKEGGTLSPILYRAASISYIAGVSSLLLILILHFIKTDLPPAGHMLSEYAIGDYGWIMKAAFFAWSLSCVSLAVALRSQVVTKSGRVGVTLLFIAGAALIMGGLFVIDPPYAEPVQPTMHGSLHGLSAMIGLPGQAIASLLISYSLKKNPAWRSATKPIIRLAHFTWISLVLMFASTIVMMSLSNGKFSSITAIGWFNRLAVVMYCGWLISTASSFMSVNKERTHYSANR